MKKLLGRIFYSLFLLVIICYVLGLLSTEISPQWFWPISFFGLAFSLFFFILCFYTIYYLLTKNKKSILGVFFLLLGYLVQPSFYALSLFTNQSHDQEVKIITYNVRNFNLYEDREGNDRDKIIAYLKEEDPDIVCFQEAYQAPNWLTLSRLKKELSMPYVHFEQGVVVNKNRKFGLLTVSKYPIVQKQRIDFNAKGNLAMRSDLLINDDTISVYNLHLASVHLGPEDYEYLENIQEENQHYDAGKTYQILRKLKASFIKRSKQANIVKQEVKQNHFAKIVCGDFNDTSTSYAYSTVKGDLQDTFTKGNFGIGNSYAGPLPFVRIDHVFTSKQFKVLDHDINKLSISDHYPVIVKIKQKKEQ